MMWVCQSGLLVPQSQNVSAELCSGPAPARGVVLWFRSWLVVLTSPLGPTASPVGTEVVGQPVRLFDWVFFTHSILWSHRPFPFCCFARVVVGLLFRPAEVCCPVCVFARCGRTPWACGAVRGGPEHCFHTSAELPAAGLFRGEVGVLHGRGSARDETFQSMPEGKFKRRTGVKQREPGWVSAGWPVCPCGCGAILGRAVLRH